MGMRDETATFRVIGYDELMAMDFGPKHPRPALVALASGEDPARPTWAALVRHEPRLESLLILAEAVSADGNPRFCANAVWYPGLKRLLVGLVGWSAEHDDPMLTTEAAYDLAYERLYLALPDCRHAVCCFARPAPRTGGTGSVRPDGRGKGDA